MVTVGEKSIITEQRSKPNWNYICTLENDANLVICELQLEIAKFEKSLQ